RLFCQTSFRKPHSAFVGVPAFTLRRLFCPPPRERAPAPDHETRSLALGQRRAAEPPPSPTRHAVSRVTAPLTKTGAASRPGATEQGAPHEAGLDSLAFPVDATARRRLAVPQHDALPGSPRPVVARPAGG